MIRELVGWCICCKKISPSITTHHQFYRWLDFLKKKKKKKKNKRKNNSRISLWLRKGKRDRERTTNHYTVFYLPFYFCQSYTLLENPCNAYTQILVVRKNQKKKAWIFFYKKLWGNIMYGTVVYYYLVAFHCFWKGNEDSLNFLKEFFFNNHIF